MSIKILHGRLTRDPELTRKDDDAKSYVRFCVATDRRFGDESDFHDCIIFGKRAYVIEKYFAKGSEIVCFGEEHHEPYTDKNGVKRKSVTLFVDQFDFCGSKGGGQSNPQSGGLDSFQKAEEDIPF